jgi:hypothetical protein
MPDTVMGVDVGVGSGVEVGVGGDGVAVGVGEGARGPQPTMLTARTKPTKKRVLFISLLLLRFLKSSKLYHIS